MCDALAVGHCSVTPHEMMDTDTDTDTDANASEMEEVGSIYSDHSEMDASGEEEIPSCCMPVLDGPLCVVRERSIHDTCGHINPKYAKVHLAREKRIVNVPNPEAALVAVKPYLYGDAYQDDASQFALMLLSAASLKRCILVNRLVPLPPVFAAHSYVDLKSLPRLLGEPVPITMDHSANWMLISAGAYGLSDEGRRVLFDLVVRAQELAWQAGICHRLATPELKRLCLAAKTSLSTCVSRRWLLTTAASPCDQAFETFTDACACADMHITGFLVALAWQLCC